MPLKLTLVKVDALDADARLLEQRAAAGDDGEKRDEREDEAVAAHATSFTRAVGIYNREGVEAGVRSGSRDYGGGPLHPAAAPEFGLFAGLFW